MKPEIQTTNRLQIKSCNYSPSWGELINYPHSFPAGRGERAPRWRGLELSSMHLEIINPTPEIICRLTQELCLHHVTKGMRCNQQWGGKNKGPSPSKMSQWPQGLILIFPIWGKSATFITEKASSSTAPWSQWLERQWQKSKLYWQQTSRWKMAFTQIPSCHGS